MRTYVESERYDEKVKTAARMIADGDLPVEKIAQYSGLALEKVLDMQKELQPI